MLHNNIPSVIQVKPLFKSVLWGGERIAQFKGMPPQGDTVGESWELSPMPGNESVIVGSPFNGMTLNELLSMHGPEILGQRVTERFGDKFPLLIKFIDSADDLSIQVHPDDMLAGKRHNSLGKTEMWLVLKPTERASLYAGFNQKLTADSYRRAVADGTVTDKLNRFETHPGDVFMLPAGRVHSIGRGNFLVEIQEASDITYRIYDFDRRDQDGNPRQLHVEESVDAIDFNDTAVSAGRADFASTTPQTLATCHFFTTKLVNLAEPTVLDLPTGQSFTVVIAIEGDTDLCDARGNRYPLKQGTTVLIPACVRNITAHPQSGISHILTVEV